MWGSIDNWRQWLVFIGVLLVAIGAALALHYLLIRILRGLARRGDSKGPDLLIRHLRCLIREKLVEFIQRSYPHALPRLRADLQGPEDHAPDAG